MQPEISKKKKVKATNNKKTKEKALVSGKLQENRRKNVQKEIKKNKKQMKIKEKAWMRCKSKKKI